MLPADCREAVETLAQSLEAVWEQMLANKLRLILNRMEELLVGRRSAPEFKVSPFLDGVVLPLSRSVAWGYSEAQGY